jgi:hypothetical protein
MLLSRLVQLDDDDTAVTAAAAAAMIFFLGSLASSLSLDVDGHQWAVVPFGVTGELGGMGTGGDNDRIR